MTDKELRTLLEEYDDLNTEIMELHSVILSEQYDDFGRPVEEESVYVRNMKYDVEQKEKELAGLKEVIIKKTTVYSKKFADEMAKKLTQRTKTPYATYIRSENDLEYLCIAKKELIKQQNPELLKMEEIIVDVDTKITSKTSRSTVESSKFIKVGDKMVEVKITSFLPLEYKGVFSRKKLNESELGLAVPFVEP